MKLLDLVRRATDLFAAQPPAEKRRLLNFALSNCTWANGSLTVEFRQPFDLLAVATGGPEVSAAGGGEPAGRRLGRGG